MYIIGIDAGNSRIKLGLFRNARLMDVIIAETAGFSHFKLPSKWKRLKPQSIGLASVVPSVNSAIIDNLGCYYGIRAQMIGPSDCGIRLAVKNPGKVGVDRILNCRAALEIFGSPVLVIDAGTAITVDAATERDGFVGGSIIPGSELWGEALSVTALIAKSRYVYAKFPGKSTDEAVSCGIRYGIPGAVNGILEASMKKYPSAVIILTGGGSAELHGKIAFNSITRKYLTLEGIGIILAGRCHGN